jgi:hypothetical protein
MIQTIQNQPQISAHISLEELPEEAFLPPRLVVTPIVFQQIIDMIDNPAQPTEAMVELMRGNPNLPVATK